MKNILITGALGQLGPSLQRVLRKTYGIGQVVLTDIHEDKLDYIRNIGPFEQLDVLDGERLAEIVQKHNIDCIYHLAGKLHITSEIGTMESWNVNMNGLLNVLEVARQYNLKVFNPSSDFTFGLFHIEDYVPQNAVQRPDSIYGICKSSGELIADYYSNKFNVDVRGLRFPGIISPDSRLPRTVHNYATASLFAASNGQIAQCPITEHTKLPFIYADDACEAALLLMERDEKYLKHRNAFNIMGFHATPFTLEKAIQRQIPEFRMNYDQENEQYQKIADMLPNSLLDYCCKVELEWKPKFDLDKTVNEMILRIREKIA